MGDPLSCPDSHNLPRLGLRPDRLEGVLCHCQIDTDGHPLGTPGCTSVVKAGNRGPAALCPKSHGPYQLPCSCQGPARGTCPECGKWVKAVGLRLDRGYLVRPAIASHRVGGRACPGTGRVPAETTYTPPAWARDEVTEP